jgi:hypothetical protein
MAKALAYANFNLKLRFVQRDELQSPYILKKDDYMRNAVLYFLFLLPIAGHTQTGLFSSDSILNVKLSGDIRKLMNDRSDTPGEHNLILSYQDGGVKTDIQISSRTRGNFRRKLGDCVYPPIMLLFKGTDKENTLFKEQEKLKLVVPCKNDEYVLREYMVYRVYNLITPFSFRVRLIKLTLEDTKKKKSQEPFYAMLLEEEDQMAARNKMLPIEKQIPPVLANTTSFLNMAVFQYMIGNTDWSVEYQQNIKLIAPDSATAPLTIPYDFDHAGLVDAPYAKPPEPLELSSVRERRFRGYCLTDLKEYNPSFELFNALRNDIYSLYQSAPYLNAGYKNWIRKYLDDFYATINDPGKMKKDFSYPCNESGTGNIIIKGLKNEK